MKISKTRLKEMIGEELSRTLGEARELGSTPGQGARGLDDSLEGLVARVEELEGVAFSLEHTGKYEERLLSSRHFKHAVEAIIGDRDLARLQQGAVEEGRLNEQFKVSKQDLVNAGLPIERVKWGHYDTVIIKLETADRRRRIPALKAAVRSLRGVDPSAQAVLKALEKEL